MADRKYYCMCDSNCKFETMTKEQILAAIAQAAETGLVFDEDAAFITKVKERNAGGFLAFWVGTQAEYNAIAEKDPNCYYHITNSTKDADIAKAIEDAAASITVESLGAAPMKYAKKVGAPHNLLDNSDFRNPVNQRGQTSYNTTGYTIDRWDMNATMGSVDVVQGGVFLTPKTNSAGYFNQAVESSVLFGKKLTFAVKLANGELVLATVTYPESAPTSDVTLATATSEQANLYVLAQKARGLFRIRANSGKNPLVEWAALYEGEYTAETLPEYQPKGYAAELLECRRYYATFNGRYIGAGNNASRVFTFVPLAVPMRVVPSVSVTSHGVVWASDGTAYTVTEITVSAQYKDGMFLRYTIDGTIPKIPAITLDGAFELSADL